ncbi:MAG: M23 family metallopeptidase, partial [Spirochaetes bacterium]|nr:M23 family metallopeptidase [Spirochaetota bacterium]
WRAHLRGKYTARDKEYHLNRLGSERDADGVYVGSGGGSGLSLNFSLANIPDLANAGSSGFGFNIPQFTLDLTSNNTNNPYRNIDINFPNSGGSFGWRNNPITGAREFHTGNDYAAGGGSTYAGISGVVRLAQMMNDGSGNLVQIRGRINGVTFYTNSMHNLSNSVVVGQQVNFNTVTAIPGSTGNSTGPHIHHEVFTYSIDSAFVRRLREANIPHHISGSRIFFEPNSLYEFLDSNDIQY